MSFYWQLPILPSLILNVYSLIYFQLCLVWSPLCMGISMSSDIVSSILYVAKLGFMLSSSSKCYFHRTIILLSKHVCLSMLSLSIVVQNLLPRELFGFFTSSLTFSLCFLCFGLPITYIQQVISLFLSLVIHRLSLPLLSPPLPPFLLPFFYLGL